MNLSRETRREKLPEPGELEVPGDKGALATALALCRRNKISLTPGRRRILEILACEGRPLGAYEMIDRVAQVTGKRPAPISIYRALDFLLENSLIHRLASRNAYLACGHGHAAQEPIVFLICTTTERSPHDKRHSGDLFFVKRRGSSPDRAQPRLRYP
jgi:Fe2+ or Zn2+ uptake regulation protein